MEPMVLRPNKQRLASITNVMNAALEADTLDPNNPPVWACSDTSVGDLRPAADGMSALVGSFDALGTATITIDADGRLGDEVFPIHVEFTLLVEAAPDADAVSFDVSFGAEEDRAA